jgi:hypothetical protein
LVPPSTSAGLFEKSVSGKKKLENQQKGNDAFVLSLAGLEITGAGFLGGI